MNRNTMPAKKTTRKTTKKTAKKRTLSPAHKKALAQGRTMSATVDRYLAAIDTPKTRGRKVTKATLTQRLTAAQARLKTASGIGKVVTAQEVRDLQAKLAQTNTTNGVDIKALETAFVKIAKTFGESRGISWGSWRDAGVPGDVLKKAGIARTRG
jgi:hypothetical protein